MKRIHQHTRIFCYFLVSAFCILSHAQRLAFPTAEGYGKYALGGRGGDVYYVTNLNDSGNGSLRYGIESANGPRTIMFQVSGNIWLSKRLTITQPNITIAGQTAPEEGITLAGNSLYINANDIIVRYIRVRPGEMGGETDAVSIIGGKNIIIDHVSASWSVDETLSCQSDKADSLTVQWCIISESLTNSVHKKGAHGYGGIIGAAHQSFHHNLYAHHSSRTPKVTGRRHCNVDFRNNVIYNWGFNNCYDGTASYLNWVNNYYKPGPATNIKVQHRIFELSDKDISPGKANSPEDSNIYETSLYAEGNYIEGFESISENNWAGGIDFTYGASEDKNKVLTPAFNAPPIVQQNAQEAFHLVIKNAGASLYRDAIDFRIIKEVLDGTFTYGQKGLIDKPDDVGGFIKLKNNTVILVDSDQDGIPDEWEIKNNLNPYDESDGNKINDEGYTMLEVFLSELADKQPTSDKILFKEDFECDLDSNIWKIEQEPHPGSFAECKNGKLVIDTKGGTTIWFNNILSNNITIEYDWTVVVDSGKNDRLSDLNQFWMASDPRNQNLFTRNGQFRSYDNLSLYYVGFGGNKNTTTRFRKYDGLGQRILLDEHTDPIYLLTANHTYRIKIVIKDDTSYFYVDNKLFFEYKDESPLTKGYFGFRTVRSRHFIDNFIVYKL